MSRDVFFESLTAGHRPLVALCLARGDRVFVFDFTNRLMSQPWLRRLIHEGRVERIFIHGLSVEEGLACEAAEWLAPRLPEHPIAAALRRLYGAEEVEALVRQAILLRLYAHLFIRGYLQRHAAGVEAEREVVLVPTEYDVWARVLHEWPELPRTGLGRVRMPRALRWWSSGVHRLRGALRALKGCVIWSLVLGAAWRAKRSRSTPSVARLEVDHLYAIDQPFQAKFQGRRGFDFLVDGHDLTPQNTAFLVHPSAEGPWMADASHRGYHVVTRRACMTARGCLKTPPQTLVSAAAGAVLMRTMMRPGAPLWLSELAVLGVWMYVAASSLSEHVGFKTYVYTNQEGLEQRCLNAMWRRLGAESWCFALAIGGGYLWGKGGDFPHLRDPLARSRLWAYQNQDHSVLQSAAMVEYQQRHRQRVGAYHNVGNIWAQLIREVDADESADLRDTWFGPEAEAGKVVAWFDTSFVEHPSSPSRFSDAIAWYRDIERLVGDRDDLFMIIKPSKAAWFFTDETFQWYHPLGHEVVACWERLARHPRVRFAGHDGDPATIMAASDLVVTFCYSSTTAEALGARKRALWYEPGRRWAGTFYDVDPLLVAHGYDELTAALHQLLYGLSEVDYQAWLDARVRGLVEDFLDGRGLSRFRTLLADAVGRSRRAG